MKTAPDAVFLRFSFKMTWEEAQMSLSRFECVPALTDISNWSAEKCAPGLERRRFSWYNTRMEDDWQDCYTKVTLDTIVITEEDIYMTGLTENGDSVEEIYFDSIDTDKMASIADAIWDRNYKL